MTALANICISACPQGRAMTIICTSRQCRSRWPCRTLSPYLPSQCWGIGQRPAYHFRNGFPANSPTLAVVRRKPNFNQLRPLAGITRTATKGDVGPCDYPGIVNDMLPSRGRLSRSVRPEAHTAINAFLVPAAYFSFKRRRNFPAISQLVSA